MRRILICFLLSAILFGCGVSKKTFSPYQKYSSGQLQKDYQLYQDILEKYHPGLYWYTSKDNMDNYFAWGKGHLKDSMTEPEFRKILNYVTAKIDCGHTTVRSSKNWNRYMDTARPGKMFPLSMKIWNDTMVVTQNLNRRDSVIRRGTVITKINGKTAKEIIDTLVDFVSTDGYNRTHKYQSLSNRGFFSSLYTSLHGLSAKYSVEYLDAAGNLKTTTIPVYIPAADTFGRNAIRPVSSIPKPSKKERKRLEQNSVRLLKIDTVNHTAMMDLASFGRNYGLRKFFNTSFRALRQNKTSHLIIDVRSNGGGSITNSTAISKYIADKPFKICDSLYAIRKKSPYQQYI
ncbi:MAG TPA: S41 family peptidase, partial [Chitinophagaceae bacterium]|nr:S41 family peptidase [Chitinophagaceae bacterium]